MSCRKCGGQKYVECDALACHSRDFEYRSKQDAKLSCQAKMSRDMEIKALKMKYKFLFYVPESFVPDVVLASDSCFRNSIGGSCPAARNEHEQVERDQRCVASEEASTEAKDVEQTKPSIASQKEKGLLISSPSPHKVYLPSSGFATGNQAVSCWISSWPVGTPEAQSLTPIIWNLKHTNPSFSYLSIAKSCVSAYPENISWLGRDVRDLMRKPVVLAMLTVASRS
ncbi:hypothetical protein OIU76_006735 [Salix suchowensis]|nr:hypothetical protein OIU76_006735 [Salix suchowensis]